LNIRVQIETRIHHGNKNGLLNKYTKKIKKSILHKIQKKNKVLMIQQT